MILCMRVLGCHGLYWHSQWLFQGRVAKPEAGSGDFAQFPTYFEVPLKL